MKKIYQLGLLVAGLLTHTSLSPVSAMDNNELQNQIQSPNTASTNQITIPQVNTLPVDQPVNNTPQVIATPVDQPVDDSNNTSISSSNQNNEIPVDDNNNNDIIAAGDGAGDVVIQDDVEDDINDDQNNNNVIAAGDGAGDVVIQDDVEDDINDDNSSTANNDFDESSSSSAEEN